MMMRSMNGPFQLSSSRVKRFNFQNWVAVEKWLSSMLKKRTVTYILVMMMRRTRIMTKSACHAAVTEACNRAMVVVIA